MSIVDIASGLGLHPNTVRFHLDALVKTGQIEHVEPQRRSPGRPPLLFRATRTMDPTGPRNYQLLAEVLVDALADSPDARRHATEAGRSWWHQHSSQTDHGDDPRTRDPLHRLVSLLDELGFAPQISTEPTTTETGSVDLHHCPFLEFTDHTSTSRSEVVCPIHLGLMQGALEQWQAPMTVHRLEPLIEPDRCVVHLAATAKP